MCGGFSLTVRKNIIKKRFKATLDGIISPNFNARPGQKLPVILNINPGKVVMAKWGYLPHFIKDSKMRAQINARGETIAEKRFFSDSFKKRRCIVPSDGFYEWQKVGGGKQPYRIVLKSGEPFGFAGIWDIGVDEKEKEIALFTIITTEANAVLEPIHDRMPVILREEDEERWMDENLSLKDAISMLKPYPAREMRAYKVSKLVNYPGNNSPEVVKEVR